jgi:hypothetical protein
MAFIGLHIFVAIIQTYVFTLSVPTFVVIVVARLFRGGVFRKW